MSVQKNDVLQQFFDAAQEMAIQRKPSQAETKSKQVDYEENLRKLEEKHSKMVHLEKQDLEQLWGSIHNLASQYNAAGDYFLKIGYNDLALPYLEKARYKLDSVTNKDLRERNEWKILKVQIMRNLSTYHNDKGDYKKAANCLEKIFKIQTELDRDEVVLQGFEFVYMKLSYYSMKEKKWDDTLKYATHAVNYLEKILEIKKGRPILENKPISDDKNSMIVYDKKLVTLSYAYYYLLSKALLKKNNFIDAIKYLENAYQISAKYLGREDSGTVNIKKKLDAVLNKLSKLDSNRSQPLDIITPNGSFGVVPTTFISTQPFNSRENKEKKKLEVNVSKANSKAFHQLGDFMGIMAMSPSLHDMKKQISHRETLQPSPFGRPDKFLSPREGKGKMISLASQMSGGAQLSTKNASSFTQNIIESSTIQKDDLYIFDQPMRQFHSPTLFSSNAGSNLGSGSMLPYVGNKFTSPTNNTSMQNTETKSKRISRMKSSGSFAGKDFELKPKHLLYESMNQNNYFNTEVDPDIIIEPTSINKPSRVTFRPETPTIPKEAYPLFMNERPQSSNKHSMNKNRNSLINSRDQPSFNKSIGLSPQQRLQPPTIVSSRVSRTSIGKVNYRPASAATKSTMPRAPARESMLRFNIPPKSKSRSPPKTKSRSPSLSLDHERDIPGIEPDKFNGFMMESESSITTERSGIQEVSHVQKEVFLPQKQVKLSKGLVNVLKMDAKKSSQKFTSEALFQKPEVAAHVPDQIEDKFQGLEQLQNIFEHNKIDFDDKHSPNKIDPGNSTANELISAKGPKQTLAEFRQMERIAARKIQLLFKRFMRRVRKLRPMNTNANLEDQNLVLSTNELNSVQNVHGKHGESLLEANIDNYYPSHNNLETASSGKPSKVLRKSNLMKGINENNKVVVENLYTTLDDQAYEYIQRIKLKKEEEEDFLNKSFTVDEKFMMPRPEEELVPKIEIIKRNLKNLKDYEISFYGYFFGESGLWTLKYGGLAEKKDNLYLIFYLCYGTINHPIKVRADPKVTEKAMFYSTIWRVISANLNGYLTKEELIFQLKERISNKEERLFLIIKDLKKEEKLSPILRITPMELESLREMLIKLCFILETKFIIYKKPTGYIYEWARRVENSQTATRNRQYLLLSKWKLQKQIRKLATQYNPFYYTLDRGQYSIKMNTQHEMSIYRTLSGGSLRKSVGAIPAGALGGGGAGSDSDREEEFNIQRTQTTQARDLSEFTRKKKRKSMRKVYGKGQKPLSPLETPAREHILKLQEQYKNPFVQNQILFQNLLHVERQFLLASLRVTFSKNAADEVSEESQIDFIIEAELFGGTRWRDQLKLPYKEFMDKVKHLKVSLKEFMINSGFLAKQRRLLSEFFLQNVSVLESRIQMKDPHHEARSQVKFGDSSALEELKIQLLEKGRPRTIQAFFKKLKAIQDARDEDEEEPSKDKYNPLKKAKIKVLSLHDPNFGGSEVISQNVQVGQESRMQYYNSLKYLKPRTYYVSYFQMQNQRMLRINYVEKGSESYMDITLYHHCRGTVDFILIKEKKTQERLLNVMQMNSEEMKKKSLTEIFEFHKSLIGNKLLLNEKLKLERYNKKFDISPMNISQILMTHGDENLPKYRIDIQKHFTKGVINNLGNCYITITTYFIKNLYKFDNIFCIKFEIMPFISKTKFYKFLINSKDIKLYLNKDYPKANPYENWDTIHFIIQSLVLKRQYVYSSIELPIKDTKFMLMKYHKYNLKNVVSQSIESSSIGAQVIFGNFLQPKIQESQVVLQITKKIAGNYVIITIERHTILDHLSVIVYDPKTCRRYVTSIYTSDIDALNPNFLDMLSASVAVKLEHDRKLRPEASRFTKSYIEVTGDNQPPSGRIKKRPSRKDEHGSIIFEEKGKISGPKDSKANDQNERNFYDMRFWQNFVKHLEFSYTKSGNILLILDTFRGVMREFIYRETLQTSNTEESLVEVFLENNYRKYTMFQTINHISLPYIQNHDLFVRVTRLEKMTIYNNRFNLKQVIELYEKENLRDKMTLLKNNKIVFSQIKTLSQYMTYKVKKWNMVLISENELSTQSMNKESVLPWTNYKLKLNCNFETITKIDHQRLFIDQQLIFRGILTACPLQMVSLVYDETKGTICAFIYDTKESWILKKTIKMRDIIANIPYVKVMLEQKLHYEVGKRIYEALKNSLIVYSFMKKKKTT